MNNLQKLKEMVEELSTTNSSNEKRGIIAKYPECKQLLMYTYNPYYVYGVTSANCIKLSYLSMDELAITLGESEFPNNIIEILDMLRNRKATGHDAVKYINSFNNLYPEYKELVFNILDRNLKVRVDAKLINKEFPGCVPTFNVALANEYSEKSKITFDNTWLTSRKVDGNRCVVHVESPTEVNIYSRSGKKIETLNIIKDEFRRLVTENPSIVGNVFDGEICLIGQDGLEDFSGIQKQIRRKNHTISNPRYLIFDCIDFDVFSKEKGGITLTERYIKLNKFIPSTNRYLKVLEQIPLNEKSFEEMKNTYKEKGWEGLIIRKADIPYEGKRSNNMLKMKSFHDDEFIVKDVEVGPFRAINKETGLQETIETVTNVLFEYKGNIISSGSGFSLDQRKYYYEHLEKLKGAEVTIQYFEECKDQKTGLPSLRFPTVKAIYENGRSGE